MADKTVTSEVYKRYADKIVTVLSDEEFYKQYKARVEKGSSIFKLGKKRLIQDISLDWIDAIEEVLPNLDTIVRNPRKFIVQEEDIVDVSLARSISTESVKFLAQHTNMISKVDKDGSVTPSKILNITKEESFEIYENRFIYTLLLKLKDFVTMRYDKIKKASATQDVLELDLESRFSLPNKKITMKTEYFAQLSFDEVMRLDPETLTKIERVAKIDRIITDFLSSSFAKSMRNSAPVRPPIMRTNVILKEPNFKKALTLWQFIETYNAQAGFSMSDEVEDYDIETSDVENLKSMVTLNSMLFESLYEQETDFSEDDKDFGDSLRVGEMDFEKDKIDRDEYAQKLDENIENEDEKDKLEEVAPVENEESEKPLEQENEEPEETEEEEQQEEQKPDEERQPEVEEKEKEVEKEILQEVEHPVEVERVKEMAPKADQEEVDLEPDAEKFDQHLFDVRKLYKRPDSDRLKQEDIVKVKDAIDRCMISYRRIKQEEIEERERAERIRVRRENMEKRAAALRNVRLELETQVAAGDSSEVFFGIDPFGYQRAKLASAKKNEELRAKREKQKLKVNENEKLELEGQKEEIERDIAAMEGAAADAQKEPVKKNRNTKPKQPADSNAKQKADEKAVNTESRKDKPESAAKPKSNKAKTASAKTTDANAVKPEKPKRKKNIVPVDESKVQVGDIHFKHSNEHFDPFAITVKPKKKESDIDVVDESKVQVGEIHIKGDKKRFDPFAMQPENVESEKSDENKESGDFSEVNPDSNGEE